MTQVAVLGSGPAGLLAALAAEQSGLKPVIFSKGEKSPMFGAMYLHRAIPGLNRPDVPDFEIDIIKTGSQEGYAYNVYGDKEAPCSWEQFSSGSTPAWDLPAVYDELWNRYCLGIRRFELSAPTIGSICANYPLVLSTIPVPAYCARDHVFDRQDIWVVHGPGTHLIEGVNDDNLMYYNGYPWDGSFQVREGDIKGDDEQGHGSTFIRGHEWYRFSQINRYQAWEYSRRPDWEWKHNIRTREGRQVSEGIKPLSTNCDCFLEFGSFVRLGRFGSWTKGVLTHHAYERALEACHALQ